MLNLVTNKSHSPCCPGLFTLQPQNQQQALHETKYALYDSKGAGRVKPRDVVMLTVVTTAHSSAEIKTQPLWVCAALQQLQKGGL